MKKLTIAVLIAVAGCSTPEQRAAQDDSYCKDIGAQPGTPVYVECRLRRDEQRESRRRAALQNDLTCNRVGNAVTCF